MVDALVVAGARAAGRLLAGPALLLCSSRCPEVPPRPPHPEYLQIPQSPPVQGRPPLPEQHPDALEEAATSWFQLYAAALSTAIATLEMRRALAWFATADALRHQLHVAAAAGSSDADYFTTSPDEDTHEESHILMNPDIVGARWYSTRRPPPSGVPRGMVYRFRAAPTAAQLAAWGAAADALARALGTAVDDVPTERAADDGGALAGPPGVAAPAVDMAGTIWAA
ncbi:unnamed protein product, partial [Prorocentrum cordatum]